MNNLTLYSFRRCPFAIRVRMVLHEKKLPFKTVDEDLKNFSEGLLKMHPEAKVPVLIHNDKVIYESAIITEYLEEQFPTPSLMPKEPKARCDVRLWTYWSNQIFKVAVDQVKYGTSRFSEKDCEGCEERLKLCVIKIEDQLRDNDWLVGDECSLADIHVFPFVRQLWKVSKRPEFLEAMTKTKSWLDSMLNRPSFVKAMDVTKK
ncbi:MAG: glutathione S-transferase family protein [Bdellovibrionaceae bacterium]|nr:glutathione S-transferase family protein [Pseudobdellovibrionaceae bacterium]